LVLAQFQAGGAQIEITVGVVWVNFYRNLEPFLSVAELFNSVERASNVVNTVKVASLYFNTTHIVIKCHVIAIFNLRISI
jgi:hypothetical protein